jgi:uncharacterized protein (DUF305 family)
VRWSRRLTSIAVASIVAVGAVTAAIVLLVDGRAPESSGPRVVQPGAPGQPGRTLSGDDLSSFTPPPHAPADTRFMQGMIPHHEQALRMTALVATRGASADVTRLATRIELSQRDEIVQMQRWLTERGEAVPPPASGHAGHGASMPGMLTDAQFAQLEQARGVAFDRAFLRLMIQHHEGALTMVRELYAQGGGVEPTCDRFAREVNADQTIEIGRMRSMLATRSA